MRKTFTLLLAIISYAAHAQFSIQPQVGLESSGTTIKINDQSFSPKGMQFAPRVALRMDYKFKKGGGPFLGIATSSPAVAFKFTDPQTAKSFYTASAKDLQFRFEGGYQLSTRRIPLGKAHSSNASAYKTFSGEHHSYAGHMSYGGHMSCGQHSAMGHCSRSANKTTSQSKGAYMRILPSAGFAFMPSEKNTIETETKGTQTTYEYKAGAWSTALMAGAAFEFGTRNQPNFVVSINYINGLGNMQSQTVNSVSNGKATATTFKSAASGFNVSLGIPIRLNKSKAAPQKHQCQSGSQHRCGQYRMIYEQ